jgi:tRNA G10  N-methylase Trm11
MQILFTFDTPFGPFSDSLSLPDDHSVTDREIEIMKQERLDNWLAIITNTSTQHLYFSGFTESNIDLAKALFTYANISTTDTVFDLGCGTCNVLIEAAKLGAKCVGVDLSKGLLARAQLAFEENNLVAELRNEDIRDVDLTGATCVYLYLGQEANMELQSKLKMLPVGTKIITQDYELTGFKEVYRESNGFSIGYIYLVE